MKFARITITVLLEILRAASAMLRSLLLPQNAKDFFRLRGGSFNGARVAPAPMYPALTARIPGGVLNNIKIPSALRHSCYQRKGYAHMTRMIGLSAALTLVLGTAAYAASPQPAPYAPPSSAPSNALAFNSQVRSPALCRFSVRQIPMCPEPPDVRLCSATTARSRETPRPHGCNKLARWAEIRRNGFAG